MKIVINENLIDTDFISAIEPLHPYNPFSLFTGLDISNDESIRDLHMTGKIEDLLSLCKRITLQYRFGIRLVSGGDGNNIWISYSFGKYAKEKDSTVNIEHFLNSCISIAPSGGRVYAGPKVYFTHDSETFNKLLKLSKEFEEYVTSIRDKLIEVWSGESKYQSIESLI